MGRMVENEIEKVASGPDRSKDFGIYFETFA